MAINETELLTRIDSLENRIAKLEKALAGGAKPKNGTVPDDYEQIIKSKETPATFYFLTNKGRVLQRSSYVTPYSAFTSERYTDKTESKLKPEWLTRFKGNLLAIGEQELLKGESEEAVIECALALRAKYRATAGLPCLLPNMSVVRQNGEMEAFKEATKSIKFK